MEEVSASTEELKKQAPVASAKITLDRKIQKLSDDVCSRLFQCVSETFQQKESSLTEFLRQGSSIRTRGYLCKSVSVSQI